MWPFTRKKASHFAAARAGEPALVHALVRISTENIITSPVTGLRAATMLIELCERTQTHRTDLHRYRFEVLGTALLGDMLTLVDDAGAELSLVARRAEYRHTMPRGPAAAMETVPPELVPFLRRATGLGTIGYRETALRQGDEIIVKAYVEPTASVAASGYRDAPVVRYTARDDLGSVVLEEVPFEPPF